MSFIMKKSASYLFGGIALILIALIGDAYVSSSVLDFSDASALGTKHYMSIGVTAALIVVGIVLIVFGRKTAKKEKAGE